MSAPNCLDCRFAKVWPGADFVECRRLQAFAAPMSSAEPVRLTTDERARRNWFEHLFPIFYHRCGPDGRYYWPQRVSGK